MRFHVVFVFTFVVLAVFGGQTQARPDPEWDGWKKIDEAGQRVFKVAKDVLPVAQGYLDVYKGFKNAADKDD